MHSSSKSNTLIASPEKVRGNASVSSFRSWPIFIPTIALCFERSKGFSRWRSVSLSVSRSRINAVMGPSFSSPASWRVLSCPLRLQDSVSRPIMSTFERVITTSSSGPVAWVMSRRLGVSRGTARAGYEVWKGIVEVSVPL
eukprot:Lithocolla_globosa_v1_NODE_1443_length_2565_cov_25.119634.p2 type:complete len:141 gc:universal NODE_1443_length_2565_cov_25.119634:1542-1964(+)